ncbi:MAG: hypothetical protein QGI46_05535 [Planctomycetota bacterium]|jgi:nicotinamidase-related amidase|nr:hypothetical protein [Planctomycetota bacterium]
MIAGAGLALALTAAFPAGRAPAHELEVVVLAAGAVELSAAELRGASLALHPTVPDLAGGFTVLPGEARALPEGGVARLYVEPGTYAVAVTLRGRPAGLFEGGVEVLESLVEVRAGEAPTHLVLRSRPPDAPRGRLRVTMRAAGRVLPSGGFHLASPLTGTLLDPRPHHEGPRGVAQLEPLPCFEWIDLPVGAYFVLAAAPAADLSGIDWSRLAAPRVQVEIDPRIDRIATLAHLPGGELRLTLGAGGAPGAGVGASAARVCFQRQGEAVAWPLFGALALGESVRSPLLTAGDYQLFVRRAGEATGRIAARIAPGSVVEVRYAPGGSEEARMARLREGTEGTDGAELRLHARRRVALGGAEARAREELLRWEPTRTALVICDMWDDHWCAGAARRVAEMAGAVNEMAAAARARGVAILHAPSSVVAFYDGTPQRERARAARFAPTPRPLSTDERWGTTWCWPDPAREAAMPIDDSNMGCDCDPRCEIRDVWTRQIASIEIAPRDFITDDGQETYNVLAERGIDHVAIAGVHLNMCVLGRPFGIRQLVHMGKEVVLVRDLTDSMYDPRMAPFVSHFEGTDLVVAHVERYWCPTILSTDFTCRRSGFRFPR